MKVHAKMYSVYLKHPFTMVVSGPTSSGKTTWVQQLIKNALFAVHPSPKHIYYLYGEYQPSFASFIGVTFIKGLPENFINNLNEDNDPIWVIIDDLMNESSKSQLISELFTKGSHHRNISVILLVQNFFNRGKEMRNITLNAHYIVLFKNPRDKTIISNIARQMYPNKVKSFIQVFEDATREPFSYLFIDLKPDTIEQLRLLGDIWSTPINVFII